MDKHYDLTYLHQVFHGQEAKVRRIVALFVARAEVLDRQMMACIRQSRLFDLHPAATTLAAGVRMLGLTSLEPLVQDIERCSKERVDMHRLPALVSQLHGSLNAVCTSMSQDLACS